MKELFLLLIDKLLIGLLIIFAGFYISKLIEKYKSKQSLFNELAKNKIQIISNCWDLANESELFVKELIVKTVPIIIEYKDNTELFNQKLNEEVMPVYNKCVKKTSDFQEYFRKNRHWLGNELYNKFVNFHSCLLSSMKSFQYNDLNNFKELENKIDKLKEDMVSVLNNVNINR